MIKDHLFSLSRKIQWYKRILVSLFALNVFSIVAGFVIGLGYIKGSFNYAQIATKKIEEIQRLDTLENNFRQIEISTKIVSKSDELRYFQKWQKLISESAPYGIGADWEMAMLDEPSKKEWINNSVDKIKNIKQQTYSEISKSLTTQTKERRLILLISALTVIFGILLPLILSWFLTKAISRAQSMLIQASREFVKDWRLAIEKGGPEPFKNQQFWIEALLILSHHLGEQIDHPLFKIGGDLAGLVQSELKLARKNDAA